MGPSILAVNRDGRGTAWFVPVLRDAGYAVDVVTSSVQGIAGWSSCRYELMIADVDAGDAEGLDLLAGTAANGPHPPVIVVSDVDDVHSKVLFFELGACDLVGPEIDRVELAARVRLWLGEFAHPRRITRGRLTLHPERRVVEQGDRLVVLSPLECRVLEHLMTGRDVANRRELVEKVWGAATDPAANVVDVCVRRLRRKLGTGVITTVRGEGYRLT